MKINNLFQHTQLNHTNDSNTVMFYSGPVIGSGLYSLGGFLLPFVTVGSIGISLAICLLFAIPSGEYEKLEESKDTKTKTKKLTWSGIFQV